jgi:hypothetical protein
MRYYPDRRYAPVPVNFAGGGARRAKRAQYWTGEVLCGFSAAKRFAASESSHKA